MVRAVLIPRQHGEHPCTISGEKKSPGSANFVWIVRLPIALVDSYIGFILAFASSIHNKQQLVDFSRIDLLFVVRYF
jgi:hypothetical protein